MNHTSEYPDIGVRFDEHIQAGEAAGQPEAGPVAAPVAANDEWLGGLEEHFRRMDGDEAYRRGVEARLF